MRFRRETADGKVGHPAPSTFALARSTVVLAQVRFAEHIAMVDASFREMRQGMATLLTAIHSGAAPSLQPPPFSRTDRTAAGRSRDAYETDHTPDVSTDLEPITPNETARRSRDSRETIDRSTI